MAAAVVAVVVLTIVLPTEQRAIPGWVLPVIEGALLVTLIAADPGAIDRRSSWLRTLSILLVSIIALSALGGTVKLIDALITGGPQTSSAGDLLEAGAIVWTANNIAFALLYWELDGGGPAARARQIPGTMGFAFPQQLNEELTAVDWRPRFIDYLYVGFTNATAFSPTDAMPLAPWAKVAMMVQSLVSLAILGLVVARAVNLFA
jgi:hypothetical protein